MPAGRPVGARNKSAPAAKPRTGYVAATCSRCRRFKSPKRKDHICAECRAFYKRKKRIDRQAIEREPRWGGHLLAELLAN